MIDELDGFVDLPELRHHWEGIGFSAVLRRDPCAFCGAEGGTVDHIVPLAANGEQGPSLNGIGACWMCNHRKGEKPLLQFLLELRMTRGQRKNMRRSFFSSEQIEQMKRIFS